MLGGDPGLRGVRGSRSLDSSRRSGIALVYLEISTRPRIHEVVPDARRGRAESEDCQLSLRRRDRCGVAGIESWIRSLGRSG